jgi:16S rRNA (uracil1498-N3)-methyltransferase
MGERRFFGRPEGSTITLDEDESHHARRVLRLEPGALVVCFDGGGASWRARIVRYEARRAILDVVEPLPAEPESRPRLCLAIALLKGEKMDLVVQKATELGVSRLVPLVTDFSEVRSDVSKRLTRWRRVALESAKQCERNQLPDIGPPVSLKSALDDLAETGVAFVERDGDSLHSFVESFADRAPSALTAFIGPEGGWSGSERTAIRSAGVASLSLGRHVLRAETAAIAALAILGFAFENDSNEAAVTPNRASRE